MAEKVMLLVCEGQTDVFVFQALAKHFSTEEFQLTIVSLAPQQDATSGTYPAHGYGGVLNWCTANRDKLQMLIDFRGAAALFVQMDTDIVLDINSACINQGHAARHCCQDKLNHQLAVTTEPNRCHYILPTRSTETWLLASFSSPILDEKTLPISNYELISDPEQQLITLGCTKKRGANKLNKSPSKYKKYSKQLVENIDLARQRCPELDSLSYLLEQYAQS